MDKLQINKKKSKSETILSLLEFVNTDNNNKEIGGEEIPDNRDVLIARLRNKINYLEKELDIINKNIIE
jgi:hypothetical protein